MPRPRLVFMGSADFSVPVLDALIAAGHEIIAVYSQPPRPADRGQREKSSAVHAFAHRKGLDVRTPETFEDENEQAAFKALFKARDDDGADSAVVVAYGLRLPTAVFDAPRLGCLNVHASLLPRWRGAAPIQRAILEGDTVTGISIMQIDEGMDTGPVLLARKVPITADTTAGTLHDELAALGAEMIVEALAGLEAGALEPVPQGTEGVTHAGKLSRADGRLDWRRPADELERRVRALNPWPGVWVKYEGERIKVLAAAVEEGAPGGGETGTLPGTFIDDTLGVTTGAGVLKLLRVQRAGRDPQDAETFILGYPMPAGTRLE
ncbi:MAG: Methionyl-tRNA formyltransferase [Alphaproteobacteria bacterium MarineAlpha3_Bin3]|nr:MAG: Methionyl-tRNA formyltransferase [Alphaproteobacteria bacterium MarineAlpha3_Bin3]